MLYAVVFVACQEDFDFQFNKSELSVLDNYVKKLVEKEVKAQMEELKNGKKIQDETINALKSQVRSERQYREELETRLKVLEGQRDCLQRSGAETVEKDSEGKETVLGESTKDNALVTSENNTHQTRNHHGHSSSIKRFVTGQDTNAHSQVAFYAYMSHDLHSPSTGHVLVFDVVETNVGSGYNHYNGVFTAPSQGPYVFSWTVVSWFNSYVYSELRVNNRPLGKIITNSQDIHDEHIGSGVVVAVLNPGDVVRVRVAGSSGTLASTDRIYTSFAGWKLN
uniref:C1q domain-containing protein n=1 Tax=Magallana gigas TaxID=29159 RepID=A0A8W8K708_MAGGI